MKRIIMFVLIVGLVRISAVFKGYTGVSLATGRLNESTMLVGTGR